MKKVCPHCSSTRALYQERFTEDLVCYQCGYRELSDNFAPSLVPGHSVGIDYSYALPMGSISSLQYNRRLRGTV